MTELKIGDWVRSEAQGIGRIMDIGHDETKEVIWFSTRTQQNFNKSNRLTKVIPKFDSFNDLFKEEAEPKPKFEVGDIVKFNIASTVLCAQVDDVICTGGPGGWNYIIEDCSIPESRLSFHEDHFYD